MKFLLSKAHIRRWIAFWIIKWMGQLVYYETATKAAPLLAEWLNDQGEISHSQLKRLILAVLMHWYDFASYQGQNLTTVPSKGEDFKLRFPYSLIFLLYNSLSNGKPIKNSSEFEEQMGGFPPIQIDPVCHLIDYVAGRQCLKLELAVGQSYYETNGTVDVSLTIRNTTDSKIILNNEHGPTVKFVAEVSQEIVLEYVYQVPEITEGKSSKIILPPRTSVTIEWEPALPKKSHYLITAQIYIPHYEKVVNLIIGLYYGIKPQMIPNSTKTFCTL